MGNEKYYFNGKNATGVLKVAKGTFIEYGEELPSNFDKAIISGLLKNGLITNDKSANAVVHEIEKKDHEIIKNLEKEIASLKRENKKLNTKVEKLEKENKVYQENSELLELEKGEKK